VESLFDPSSVAIVGASGEERKWGWLLARGALAGEDRRVVHLVNRHGGEILGRPVHRDVRELPSPPELVLVCVPPESFEVVVDSALEAGAKAIVGITSGLGERSGEAAAREAALAERVRAAGAVLLGPNCLGVFDAARALELAPWIEFPRGEIGLLSQSGNLALELGLLANRAGMGFSRFASLGNQADLEAADLIASLAANEETRSIALYIEDFRDGRRFARAAEAAGKPVVLLAAGASTAGARAAASHTGALVSESLAIDAACRAAGIVRVSTPSELLHVAAALTRPRTRGRRIAIFGDGGGHGIVAADLASHSGLEVPALSATARERLVATLPLAAAVSNPVDIAGAEQDPGCFERAADVLLESDEVDALLLTGYFGGYGSELPDLHAHEIDAAAGLVRTAAHRGSRLVVHSLHSDSAAVDKLRAGGVLVFAEIERAVLALDHMARVNGPTGVPDVSEAEGAPPADGYFAARSLLAEAGVRFAEARPVRTREELLTGAAELGFPVVLKATTRSHKSDDGGVELGIGDIDALVAAYDRLGGECSLERMETAFGLELIVGVRRDRRFGPILLVGLGGVHAEIMGDIAVALAPVDTATAARLVRSLRCAAILAGRRGRPALAVDAAAEAAAAISRVAAGSAAIRELEVNPLLVTAESAIALDARVVISD
jgi:acyl-CoA synthetase (NDP forming)